MTDKERENVAALRCLTEDDCICFPNVALTAMRIAADLIESLSDQLEQVTRERDAAVDELKGECDVCANRKDCTAPKCRKSPHKECEGCPCHSCAIDESWKWKGANTGGKSNV